MLSLPGGGSVLDNKRGSAALGHEVGPDGKLTIIKAP